MKQIKENENIIFGNYRDKVNNYKAFWNRENMERPLVGFTFRKNWFILDIFEAAKNWQSIKYLTPDMIEPEEFIKDQVKIFTEGEIIKDDIIRGDCAISATIPWLAGILGAKLRVLPGNIVGEDLNLSWEECNKINIDKKNPWLKKYIECTKAMVKKSNGNFPISHAAYIHGPSDLLCLLRGTTQATIDLIDAPEKVTKLLGRLSDIFVEITEEVWKEIPLYHGGYYDASYQLWAPGPIIRLQEDATFLYSPELYRKFLQPVDREIASKFSNSFMHLHSTSMFLLEDILEIDEIKAYEINNDECGPEIKEMIPYFQMVQKAEKPLIIKGAFTNEEIKLLVDSLEPQGLYLYIAVHNIKEINSLKTILGMV